ncbi:HK97 family phage prohead protease [Priestia megaterium]|uniref:HK97 family phage prohead protease n=1 Tax=Priestia megaterium TaxID=1404 RepID=UPI001C54E956|nr:HK97 family phage prohead protease [Priestia megaterium]MED3972257.1 HK97 family phage prohead protease [Priestia megaterium]
MEERQVDVTTLEVRATENNDYILEGYINKFNTRSLFMGFYEEVQRGAFDRTLADGHNIFALKNHNNDYLLGSTKSNSLSLHVDDIGLRFELKINPEISYAKDVYHLVKGGLLEGCSFGFYCLDDQIVVTPDGTEIRYLKDIELIEVTLTNNPAYTSSQVSCRSYDEFKAKQLQNKKQQLKREKLKLKLKYFN